MIWRWIVAASAAALVIVGLATTGQRPEPGLVRFEAAGVMVHIPPDRVIAVDVRAHGRHARFERDASGAWRRADGGISSEGARRLDEGLKLLHGSAPQRTMTAEELPPTALRDFTLDPPRCAVGVVGRSGETFAIDFGDLNPQALAQYARVRGRADVVLLGRYVGDRWQSLLDPETFP